MINSFAGITSKNINTLFPPNERPTKKSDSEYLLGQSNNLSNDKKIQFINLLKAVSIGTRDDVNGVITPEFVKTNLTDIFIGQDQPNPSTDNYINKITSAVVNIAQIMRPGQARLKEYFTRGITVSQTVKDLIRDLSKTIDRDGGTRVMRSNQIRENIIMAPMRKAANVKAEVMPILEKIINFANVWTVRNRMGESVKNHLTRLFNPPVAGQAHFDVTANSPHFTKEAVDLSKILLSQGINDSGTHFICDNNGKVADVIFTLLQNGYIKNFGRELQKNLAVCLAYEASWLTNLTEEQKQKLDAKSGEYLTSLETILNGVQFATSAERRHLRAIVNIGDFFDDKIDDRLSEGLQKTTFTALKTDFLNKLSANGLINHTAEVCAGQITLIYGNHDDGGAHVDDQENNGRIKAVLDTMRPFSIDTRHDRDFFIAHLPIFKVTDAAIHTGFGVVDITGCKNRHDVWQQMEALYMDNKNRADGKGNIGCHQNKHGVLNFNMQSMGPNTFPDDAEINAVLENIPNHPILGTRANNGRPLVIVNGHYNHHVDGNIQYDYPFPNPFRPGEQREGIRSNSECAVLNMNSYAISVDGHILGGFILQPELRSEQFSVLRRHYTSI